MAGKSFQERYYLHEPGLLRHLWRDIRYVGYVLKVIFYWTVLGAGVRRAYRRAEKAGAVYRVDGLAGEDI